MKKEYTYDSALRRAAELCSAKEYCLFDIRERIRSWGISEKEVQKIIDYLKEEKYLDDNRFVKAYVKDKFRFNKWGKIKIAYSLRFKNIDNKLIDDALESIDIDDYKNTIFEIMKTKLKGLKYKDSYEAQAKLVRFATSHGFEPDFCFAVAKTLISD
ncbi:MAG: RecX family transcriptional regulator [Paludibacteraceae bacterium]|nr:RecX family transcriptional regulator [Paludibacteraceae bacterium]